MFLNIQYLFLLPNQHLFSLNGKAVFTKFPIKKCRPAATLLREFVSQILLSFPLHTCTFLLINKKIRYTNGLAISITDFYDKYNLISLFYCNGDLCIHNF